jgi:hypothetical protein
MVGHLLLGMAGLGAWHAGHPQVPPNTHAVAGWSDGVEAEARCRAMQPPAVGAACSGSGEVFTLQRAVGLVRALVPGPDRSVRFSGLHALPGCRPVPEQLS